MVIGLGLILPIGLADRALDSVITLELVYLVPIAFAAWYGGRRRGLCIALCCGVAWFGANRGIVLIQEHPLLGFGDLATHLASFVVFSLLVAYHRRILDRERTASRTDFLTGALNRRAFYELVEREIERVRRNMRPFTVAYIDIDNFKAVNDDLGHVAGDEALRHVVYTVNRHLRVNDSIARLGGDEFAILLPETDRHAAQTVVDKIRLLIQQDMAAQRWPITLSIGVLTCECPPNSIDAMMRLADRLMYSVKQTGKDAIVYSACCDAEMPIQAA
jgi:diguanylate cyclase (GGDEF)-like protein